MIDITLGLIVLLYFIAAAFFWLLAKVLEIEMEEGENEEYT